MAKTKFSDQSALAKSLQPILICLFLLVIGYIAYKVYIAMQDAIQYDTSVDVTWLMNRSAHEGLKKRGLSIDGSQAKLQVKGIDEARYLDQTQR